jgi:hypothetical protein
MTNIFLFCGKKLKGLANNIQKGWLFLRGHFGWPRPFSSLKPEEQLQLVLTELAGIAYVLHGMVWLYYDPWLLLGTTMFQKLGLTNEYLVASTVC